VWKSVFNEFNAYFNTYYNAKTTFEQIEENLKSAIISDKFPSFEKLDKETQLNPNDRSKLDDVIKKCSKILQYYLETSIADDALLMIGKSYFYQDNYLGAERKFVELISTFPKSKLYDEALYYLMLTLAKEKKYSDLTLSFQAKARENSKSLWKLHTVYAFAKFKLGEIDSAIFYLNLASKKAKGEDKAQILFYLGELNENINPSESANFYLSASKITERTSLKTYSLIKYASQQRKLGNFELAQMVLNDLIYKNIDKDYERKVYLELARTYNSSDNLEKAIQTYTYLDTTYKRTEESAYGYFELGQIYETKIGNYDSAKVFYEKARIEFPQSAITKQAQEKVKTLNEYFQYLTVLSRNDSILKSIVLNPDSTIKINPDSIKNQIAQAKYSLARIFYMSLNRLDSAIFYLNDIISNHPSSPILPRSYYLLGMIYESIDTAKASKVYLELINKFPESEFIAQAMKFLGFQNEIKKDTLEELYKTAISLIDVDPTKAIDILFTIWNHNSNSNTNLKAKALFAIAWINEYKLKNFARAVEYYTTVLNNFSNTEFAKIAQIKLNPEKQETQTKPKEELLPTPDASKKAPDEIKPTPKSVGDEPEDDPRLRERKRRRIIDDN
jgi:TolA-binding protein